MRLEWLPAALTDRDAIYDYISADNRHAAIDIDLKIETQADQLRLYPQSGRPGRIAGTRELVIPRSPYLLAYRVDGPSVLVLRVLHAAQSWPDEFTR